jgi:hypothetical protein
MRERGRIGALGAALVVCAGLVWPSAGSAANANTITIGAASPAVSNCFPFGGFLADGGWGPNFAFVYQNIPAFGLRAGDTVAFDLGFPNDSDVRVDVAMAHTTGNGNDVNDGPFTTIASNSQTPSNPRGDDVVGNYELRWTASSSFDFPGGGLLIRFSNPAGPFATDATCDASNVEAGLAGDSSGFFVGRRYLDSDGQAPWENGDEGDIAQFRLILQPTSANFSLESVARNKRKGTAQLILQVPGPGTLSLSGKGVKAKTADAGAKTSVAAAGTVKLAIKPKGKVRKKLLTRGKARVAANVTFAPSALPGHAAGDPSTQSFKVKLIRK